MERVTLGRGDRAMARVLVGDSAATLRWMRDRGIRFRLMYERQAYEDADGRWTFWGGLAVGAVDGGRGLIDQHAAAAERTGIEVRHDCAVEALERGAVTVRRPDGTRETLHARAVVLAAGGFESNPELRAAYLGPNWDVAKVRGTPYNTGEVLRAALAAGAQPYGHWSGCHAIQWDRDAPPTGDLELTNRFSRQSYPVGIVVNADGERFVDEGADFRNYTYAKYGAEVLRPTARRRPPGLRREVAPAAAQGRLRGAGGHACRRADAARARRGPGHRSRALRAHRHRLQRRDRPGRVRPSDQGRPAHARPGGREDQLGAGDRHAALRRLPGDLRDHVHLRRPARRRGRARARPLAAARSPACSRPASWSAACSSTTTPAAAA